MNVVFSCFQISVVFSTSLIQFTLQTAQFASLVYIGVLAIVVSHGISQSSAAPVESVRQRGASGLAACCVGCRLHWAGRGGCHCHSIFTQNPTGKSPKQKQVKLRGPLILQSNAHCQQNVSLLYLHLFLKNSRNKLVGILLRLVCSLQMRQ